jgi:Thioesterase domain/Phosphopantetheine attachment site
MTDALDNMTGTGYQPPRDPVEIWLARQWQDILGFAVGIRESFFDLGGNSLDAARVIDVILVEFGVQLPLNVLTEHPTVESLAALLRDHAGRLSGPLVAIQDGDGTRPPLFLVHPDNGQVAAYCRLAYDLGEEFAVSGLQAAGLYSDVEPRRTVPAMADAYVDAVRAERSTGPYLLGGCGVGAAIAYEMAVRLDDVLLLAAIDAELLEPPDPSVEADFVARSLRVRQANQDAERDWQPSPYTGPIHTFGLPPIAALPATVVQLTHECGTEGRLADALRKLIG